MAAGRVESVSAWVNEAMSRHAGRDTRLEALAAFVAAQEEEQGEVTEDEMRAAVRSYEGRAVVVRARACAAS